LPSPKIVLFDEPMVGLDPHAIRSLKETFEEIKKQGGSLLISTHMLDSVENLWDHALILKGGKLLADVRKEELESSGQNLEDLFFGLTEGEES
jgi:ABC-type multidrug transport system ATPase subunit